MTNKKIIIFAFLMALLTTGVAAMYLNQLEQEANKPDPQASVVVPKEDIKPLTQISPEMVEIIQIDEKSKREDMVSAIDEVVGAIVEVQLFKGEPILKAKIAKSEDAGSAMSYRLPEGMRAMNISYAESGVGNFLRAGDRIDIVGVVETPVKELKGYDANGIAIYEQQESKQTSQLLLQDISVLAVGSTEIRRTSAEEANQANNQEQQQQQQQNNQQAATITILVTPNQAEHVTLMERTGQMELILRPANEEENVQPHGVTKENVLLTGESGGSHE